MALGFRHLYLICIFLFSVFQMLLHKSSQFFSTNCMGGEDRLGSLTSFSVPVFRSFRSCPGFKIGLHGFLKWIYQNFPLPCRCVCCIVLQLLNSAEVAFSVDPWYLKGVKMWGHDPAQSCPGLSGSSNRLSGYCGQCCTNQHQLSTAPTSLMLFSPLLLVWAASLSAGSPHGKLQQCEGDP